MLEAHISKENEIESGRKAINKKKLKLNRKR